MRTFHSGVFMLHLMYLSVGISASSGDGFFSGFTGQPLDRSYHVGFSGSIGFIKAKFGLPLLGFLLMVKFGLLLGILIRMIAAIRELLFRWLLLLYTGRTVLRLVRCLGRGSFGSLFCINGIGLGAGIPGGFQILPFRGLRR